MCKCYFAFMHRSNIFLHEKYIRTFLLFMIEHMEISCFHKFEYIKQRI